MAEQSNDDVLSLIPTLPTVGALVDLVNTKKA